MATCIMLIHYGHDDHYMDCSKFINTSVLFSMLLSAMRLYWVDAFFDKIEHSNFDGQNRISLDRVTQISHPFGLTIFEGTTFSLKT